MEDYAIKLVRDDIAKVPNVDGATVYFKPVGRTTHLRLLKQKLAEEVAEYLLKPSLGELADILEAVECLARLDRGTTFTELRREQARKKRERGGFDRGTAMYSRAAERGKR